jgi:redox-sensitive bicupin YhaK (pirin superfamily)
MAQEVIYNFNPANKCLFIFSIEGKVSVNGTDIGERDAIGIWETDRVSIHCDAGAHFLVIETPVNQK